MWGYDRDEEPELIPFKTQDQHFSLFCMVLERGFALHTGRSERLIVDFKLSDAGSQRYLPQVKPKEGVSFRVPENCLKPSHLYLHYDPRSETDLPELASYDVDINQFVSFDHTKSGLFDKNLHQALELPVVKLSTLRGLHYIKDIACLQMFELDFDRLFTIDAALAEQMREILANKLRRFVEFTQPWLQAERAEQAAQDYLETRAPVSRSKSEKPGRLAGGRAAEIHKSPEDKDGFLTWE